ncbi:MAG TPA: PfkB family carbohydrate kinase [Verrucomicrobiae bacterium]|nr:PfkB family carbohydrate kinase [Verrucomicrobiae bacterium]
MSPARFQAITSRYALLRVAVIGDFCLDRYFEIEPARQETSIETGLPVHNITNVRCQPGGAGTILNNLAALGIGAIYPVGFCGDDGEGFELERALRARAAVIMDHFVRTPERRTFTYTKPLVMHRGRAPEELSRLDIKNWSATPLKLQKQLAEAAVAALQSANAAILLDQVDVPETGVITNSLLKMLGGSAALMLADSRRGLRDFPPAVFKMNRAEFCALTGAQSEISLEQLEEKALALARKNKQPVFITLSEQGILGAAPSGEVAHAAALPVRGEIDIVGAGDAVSANLTAALAAGASLSEAMTLANAAASIVIHQLGTTGTANVEQLKAICLDKSV